MRNISLLEIVPDIKERIRNTDAVAQLPQAMERRITSLPRIYQAIQEAMYAFAIDNKTTGLSGFMSDKEFKLQPRRVQQYVGLTVFDWPEPAFTERADGGLLHLILNGSFFDVTVLKDETRMQSAVMSLQHQASQALLYGPGYANAVADLSGNRIFVPKETEAYASIVQTPDELYIKEQARGKGTITITGPATADGNLSFTDTGGHTFSVVVTDGDSPETMAMAVHRALADVGSFDANGYVFTDELHFISAVSGPSGDTTITADAGDSGVSFSTTSLSLHAQEPVFIPIDRTYQSWITEHALGYLLRVAQLNTGSEPHGPVEHEVEEGENARNDE